MMKQILEEWRKYKKCLLSEGSNSDPCSKSQLSYAWISPTGEILKCSDYESPTGNKGHLVAAAEIIAQSYMEDKDLPDSVKNGLEIIEHDPNRENYSREEWEKVLSTGKWKEEISDEEIDNMSEEEYQSYLLGNIPKSLSPDNFPFRGEHIVKTRSWEAGRNLSDFGNQFMFHDADSDFEAQILHFMFLKGFVRMANVYNYECYIPNSGRRNWNNVFNPILKIIESCPNVEKGKFFFDLKEEDFGSSTDFSIRGVSFEHFLNWMGKISRKF